MSTPHLTRLQDFATILPQYQISPVAHRLLNTTPLVVLVAPTSAGRNTIINELLKTGEYRFIISDTTRPPRVNDGVLERDGVEYNFRSEDEMLQDIKGGRFIEAELIHQQQVSGTSIRELEMAHREGKIAIRDVDLGGALKIASLSPLARVVFIMPPSFQEWLRRIKDRSNPTPLEVRRRMQTALRHFEAALSNDRFRCVVNDDLQAAVRQVDAIAHNRQTDEAQQERAKAVIRLLQEQTVAYLRQADEDGSVPRRPSN